jgi:hypothetical protein
MSGIYRLKVLARQNDEKTVKKAKKVNKPYEKSTNGVKLKNSSPLSEAVTSTSCIFSTIRA